MKVNELIEQLRKCDPELDVYLVDNGIVYEVVEHISRTFPDESNVTLS